MRTLADRQWMGVLGGCAERPWARPSAMMRASTAALVEVASRSIARNRL